MQNRFTYDAPTETLFGYGNSVATNAPPPVRTLPPVQVDYMRPAQAALAEHGIPDAWEVYLSPDTVGGNEETTIRSIVWKLERYGSISPKQVAFVRNLLERIAGRAGRAAERAAEAAMAADVPTGRMEITGEVITVKEKDIIVNGRIRSTWKMLLKTADGWKVWGTVPSALWPLPERGDTVRLTATVEASKDDPKFGFYSRPSNAEISRKQDTEEAA